MKLRPKVIARQRTIDPLNPSQITLAEMRKYPLNLWLKYIEPRIIIMGNAPEDCWCWNVGKREHDVSKWFPQMWASWHPERKNPVMQNMNVRRFIAQMFYEFPEAYSVYRNKKICSSYNCIRPSHLIIAPHNDPEAKFG